MSTDIFNIDKIKKNIKNFQNNNFNVTKFLKSVVTKHIYMIIYLFVSAFVLYGCKIYGPFPSKNNANLFGHSFTFINPTFYQKNTQTITNIPIFMKNQMYDTYNYTMYALVFFFQSLFNINNDYIIAIIGPVLLCIYLSFLTIFGCIIFIYCYIVNLFFNFSSSASLFMRIVLIHFFTILFYILFLFIPIIQLVVIIYCLIRIFGYSSKFVLKDGTTKTGFIAFMNIFIYSIYNFIMLFSSYIMITTSFNYLGQEYSIICALIFMLIFTNIIDING
jgi:hypothetical protein